jgi:L-ascorbate metabolism protein UlaG (beta-lactamase superfamily)
MRERTLRYQFVGSKPAPLWLRWTEVSLSSIHGSMIRQNLRRFGAATMRSHWLFGHFHNRISFFVSQDAPDHCDVRAISELSKNLDVIAPSTAARKLQKMGLTVQPMEAGQSKVVRDIKISAIPSEHPGVLKQNGYLLEGNSSKILVLADPALKPDLAAAVDALPKPIDAILLASTGFTLRHFGQIVMPPEEAAQIVARASARHAFPTRTLMHEGVWGLLDASW